MNPREGILALIVGALLGVLVIAVFVVPPIESAFEDVNARADELELKLIEDRAVLAHQEAIQKHWRSYQVSGLSLEEDDARIEVQKRLNQWSLAAGVELPNIMDMRSVPGDRFVEIGFVVSATGDLAEIERFLWQIRKADIPIRVSKCAIESRREGERDLTLSITLSTTVELKPEAESFASGKAGEQTS